MSAAYITPYVPRQVIDVDDSDSDINDDSGIATESVGNTSTRQANISVEIPVRRRYSDVVATPRTPFKPTLVFVEVPAASYRRINMSHNKQRDDEHEAREDDNPSPKKRARPNPGRASSSISTLDHQAADVASGSSPDGVAASASPTKLVASQLHNLSTNPPGLDNSRAPFSSQTMAATDSDPVGNEADTSGTLDVEDDTLDDFGAMSRKGSRDITQTLPAANGHPEIMVSSRPAARKSKSRSPSHSPVTQVLSAKLNAGGQIERPVQQSLSSRVDGFMKQQGVAVKTNADEVEMTPDLPEPPATAEIKAGKGRKGTMQTGPTRATTQVGSTINLAPPPRRAAVQANKSMVENSEREESDPISSEDEKPARKPARPAKAAKSIKAPINLVANRSHSLPKYPEDRQLKPAKATKARQPKAKARPKAKADSAEESELSEVDAASSPAKSAQPAKSKANTQPNGRESLGRRQSAARITSFAEDSESDIFESDEEESRLPAAPAKRAQPPVARKPGRRPRKSREVDEAQPEDAVIDVTSGDIAVDASMFSGRNDRDEEREAEDIPLPSSSSPASADEDEADEDFFEPAGKRAKAARPAQKAAEAKAANGRGRKKKVDTANGDDIPVSSSQTSAPFASQSGLGEVDIDDLDDKVFVRVSAKLTEAKAKANADDLVIAEELEDMKPFFWWPATIENRDRFNFRVQLVVDKAKTILQYHDRDMHIESHNLDKYHLQPLVDRKKARTTFKGPSDWLADWANHAEQGDYNVPSPEEFKQVLKKVSPTKRSMNAEASDDEDIPVAGDHSSPKKSPAKKRKQPQSEEEAETTFGSLDFDDEDPELGTLLKALRTQKTQVDDESDSDALDPNIEVGTLCFVTIGKVAWPAKVAQIHNIPSSATKVRGKDGKRPKQKHGPYQLDVYPSDKKAVRVWRNDIILAEDDDFLSVELGKMSEKGKDTLVAEDELEAILPEMAEVVRGTYAPAMKRQKMFFKGQKVALTDTIHYGEFEDVQVKQVQEYLADWLKKYHEEHNAELPIEIRKLDDASLIDYAINCLAPCALELLMLNDDAPMTEEAQRKADAEIAAGLSDGIIDSTLLARIRGHELASAYLQENTPWYHHILANRQLKESAVNMRKAIKMPSETWADDYTRKRTQVKSYAEL